IEKVSNKALSNRAISRIKLPRPMMETNDFNFSFSGLKTAVLRVVKEEKFEKVGLAFEFQEAVTDVLVTKTLKAAQKFQARAVLLSGGVAANQNLRQKLSVQIKKYTDAQIFVPPISLCTDNAAMIAAAAIYHFFLEKGVRNWYDVRADANMRLKNS
ncbi:tRNA (adenosine(37)-N6)-threonylcarbamoyltransferase complex transferase subunit TsaD, partial [Candidatus Berkelbacteria bacterium]|nr:tRNA (adenosine(37)-N6)-threonylcarbamoyltransferase complex transferase subunit TsaD [Candidatus Berkelbacteria bacterium]